VTVFNGVESFRAIVSGEMPLVSILSVVVRDVQHNAKRDLEMELKKACEIFINQISARLIGPIVIFLSTVLTFLNLTKVEKTVLKWHVINTG
jgi:hypothetical protein